MKRVALMLALMALTLSTTGGSNAFARPFGCGGHMEHFGPDMGFGMLRMLERMDLSDEQERQVAALLKSHREEIGQLLITLEQTRTALRGAMLATEYSEESIKEAARAVSEQQEQMILFRAKVMNGIRAILTAEQNERLMSFADGHADRMKGFMDSRLNALDSWIAKHSQ
jgi:Spy/CpxP family protein refolding chaperone